MKLLRLLLLPLLASVSIVPLTAQTGASPASKVIEPVRVAYINSAAFLDERNGIKPLVRAAQSLELEFTSTQSELSLLNEKLRTIVGELQKLNADPVGNAKAIADKQAAGQELQQELQTKQQAGQEAYNRRSQEVQGPIITEISKEIHAFAKERDIGLMLDVSKLGDAILMAKPELDLTDEFIDYFNKKHP